MILLCNTTSLVIALEIVIFYPYCLYFMMSIVRLKKTISKFANLDNVRHFLHILHYSNIETFHFRWNKLHRNGSCLYPLHIHQYLQMYDRNSVFNMSVITIVFYQTSTACLRTAWSTHFSPNVGKYGPQKLQIRALFTQASFSANHAEVAKSWGKLPWYSPCLGSKVADLQPF